MKIKQWIYHATTPLVLVFLLLLWTLIAHWVNAPYLLPSPWQVLQKIDELKEPLFLAHLPSTFFVTSMGLLIGGLLGFQLALLMDRHPLWHRIFYPLVVGSQTIPLTTIAPLFILWFGYGPTSRIIATVMVTFFPIAISIYEGLQATPEALKELLLTYGATQKQILWKIKLPSAKPYIFAALRMAVPMSVIGAAIAEWLGAKSGLGFFSRRMMTQLDAAGAFAPIILLSAMALLMSHGITWLEKASQHKKH